MNTRHSTSVIANRRTISTGRVTAVSVYLKYLPLRKNANNTTGLSRFFDLNKMDKPVGWEKEKD
jgi:hypothetical protein